MEVLSLALRYWKYVASMLLVMATVTYYNVHVDGLIKDAVGKAVMERDGQWRDQEARAIAKAKKDALAQDASQRADLERKNKDLERRLKDAKTIHDRDVANARAGNLKLRFSTTLCTSPSNVPGAAGPRLEAPATTIDLPPEITANLYSLADSADEVEERLQGCWDKIESYVHPPMKGTP